MAHPDGMASAARPEWLRRLAASLGAEVVETHISWVLLAGDRAYKLKKPVRLPFVDYSTPERRRHFCEEEVRLNARLAPSVYLGVSHVTGTPQAPALDGPGPAMDHAVRMRRFPPGALFSEQVQDGTLDPLLVDRFADRLAAFHAAAVATQAGDIDLPLRRAQAALAGAAALFTPQEAASAGLAIAATWAGVRAAWQQRVASGHVVEGHGDLHLANVVALDGEVAAFDCIEFDPALRTLDPVDDAAFALMDFAARGQPAQGWRFFNRWLEHTGAYDGVALLRFWLVSHALVRAQVEHLRVPHGAAALAYARAALGWLQPPALRLVITHGLPGSGKSFASQQLAGALGAVRIRSDVERKRLLGLPALADTRACGVDAYTADVTARTYARLRALARAMLRAGWPVVLDAAFLRRDERAAAAALAAHERVPFGILACEAPLAVLRERLRARSGDASEADEAVLERLSRVAEPLDAVEAGQRVGSAGVVPVTAGTGQAARVDP